MQEISSRADAKVRGSQFYATGKPCKGGHVALRYTSSGECTVCEQQRRADAADKRKQQAADWYARNRARKIIEAAEWRANNRSKMATWQRAWNADNRHLLAPATPGSARESSRPHRSGMLS